MQMNGNRKDYGNGELIALLEHEFMIKETDWDCDRLTWARASIQVYDSVEDFWQQTGWQRDNPKSCTEEYLTSNRICRWETGVLFQTDLGGKRTDGRRREKSCI